MNEPATQYAFAGGVRCERQDMQWLMSGRERATRLPLNLVLVTSDSCKLPANLQDLEMRPAVGVPAGDRLQRWQLAWSGGACELAARSVHVLHTASADLAAAMPGVAPSWRGRIGWALLLNLARVPGMTRTLQALRGGKQ
jgi:hypothetical protein